jgi:uncharacterized protein (TIGR04551 family)
MIRLLAAAVAAQLLLAGAARAQTTKDAPPAPAAPAPATPAPATAEGLDPKTRALIQQEVEKAKEDIRNEVRAEMQGAQAAAEFLGAVSEGPKLEFFEADGYLRFRGQLFDDFDLGVPYDAAGYYIYPQPAKSNGTISWADMRFRFQPTLNISEYVRVKAQIDVFDNYVLGSSTSNLYDMPGSPYAVPFSSSSRLIQPGTATVDRDAIIPTQVWAEVQTPVGLLSFGRMPSHWGLGILANAGSGTNADYGDTVDRVQFAIAPVSTPIGKLAFVPMLDFDAEGVLRFDDRYGPAAGQPIDLSNADDARTFGIKIARIDTPDEIRRKVERNEASVNFGVYYAYRSQKWWSPYWFKPDDGDPATPAPDPLDLADWVEQKAYVNYADLWARYRSARLRIEMELSGVYGSIGNAQTLDLLTFPITGFPDLLLVQWGAVFLAEYEAMPNKLSFGGEFGIASGDSAPGFGNRPDRLRRDASGTTVTFYPPPYGALEGPQWEALAGDRSIKNFRFNQAYRVDLILWKEILGQVTDAFYVKPTLRWTILPGLVLDLAGVYSQALYPESTPSASYVSGSVTTTTPRGTYEDGSGSAPLGLELDTTLSFNSGTGFVAWFSWGILKPLSGMAPFGAQTVLANSLQLGLAVEF